jgi:hypothetical protein
LKYFGKFFFAPEVYSIHRIIYSMSWCGSRFDSVGAHLSQKKNPTVQNYEVISHKLVQILFAANNGDKLALERSDILITIIISSSSLAIITHR